MILRPYQEEDVKLLETLDTAGIFNQQRTGKTPTVLTALKRKGCSRNIIVAPASTLYQWQEEYLRWTGKPCVVLSGTPKKVDDALTNWTHGAVISYELFKDTNNRTGRIHDILNKNPDAIVLDEAHKIKNPTSANAKAAFKCRHIPVRYALTGTPAPNKPHEVYSIISFLKPEYKSYWKFIDTYFEKERRFGSGREYLEIGSFKKGMDRELQMLLNTFCIARKRKDVMNWLPEKDYITVRLEQTPQQKKYLKELKDFFETEHVITQGLLDRLVRYRQISLCPSLLQLKGKSPKMEYVLQYIKDYPEEPILIFSKFTSFIKILEEELWKNNVNCLKITGEVSSEARNIAKHSFQEGKVNVLLLQIDATKEGLTLDRAETIIFTDKFPPVGDLEQAEDRFVATTEDKKEKPHTVISLVMKDSYDEVLEDLIKQRASEVDIINNFKKYIGGTR